MRKIWTILTSNLWLTTACTLSTTSTLLKYILYSNVLKLIVQEYPICLDLEFVEGFLASIREKLDLFNANFHPITHCELVDRKLNSELNTPIPFWANYCCIESVAALCGKISDVLAKTGDSIEEIKKRARLAVPLLKSIEDSLSVLKFMMLQS